MQLIHKEDFIGIVPMSVNIPNKDVDLHCLDAQNIDCEPIMPTFNNVSLLAQIVVSNPTSRPQLWAFFTEYLKPFLVCKAHARFLLWHGNNITQFGTVQNQEDTSEPISDKTRAELIRSTEIKANVYLAKMTNHLKVVSYTFDTIVYSYSNCAVIPRAKTRIFAL